MVDDYSQRGLSSTIWMLYFDGWEGIQIISCVRNSISAFVLEYN